MTTNKKYKLKSNSNLLNLTVVFVNLTVTVVRLGKFELIFNFFSLFPVEIALVIAAKRPGFLCFIFAALDSF